MIHRLNPRPSPSAATALAALFTFGLALALPPPAGAQDRRVGQVSGVPLPHHEPAPKLDPCCPPWNREVMKGTLFYQGSGSISAPYTLKFQPSAAFNAQMFAYINYLHSINPAISAITIAWRLHDQGSGATPLTYYGPQVGATAWVTWHHGGTAPVFTHPNFFTVPASHMQVNNWYQVASGIFLNTETKFFPDRCADNNIYVRVQVLNAKGAVGGPVLEFSDGKQVLESVPVRERRDRR